MSQGMTSFFKYQQSNPDNSTIHPNMLLSGIFAIKYIIYTCILDLLKNQIVLDRITDQSQRQVFTRS